MWRDIVISAFLVICQTAFAQEGRPLAVYAPRPEYPEAARQRGLEGSGVFVAHVRPDGTVRSLDLTKSSGHAELDQAAKAAYQQWRFVPGKLTKVALPFTYTLHGLPAGWKVLGKPKR